jgi:uncharacterized protein (DUF885 family)
LNLKRRDFLAACVATAAIPGLAANATDAQFNDAANNYLRRLLELSPELATSLGEHRYDGRLADSSTSGRNRLLVLHQEFLKQLESIDAEKLGPQNKIDYQIVRKRAQAAVWNQTELREFEWNPLAYNPGNSLYLLLERDFAPLEARLESLRSRLDAIPEYVSAAKANLKNAPRIYTETAIAQNKGTLSLVRDLTREQAAKVPGMAEKIAPSQQRAATALEEWGRWLEHDLLPRSTRDFRLGGPLFQVKLQYALDSNFDTARIKRLGQTELAQAQRDIYETASALARKWSASADVSDRKKTVQMVLDKLAEQRPSATDVTAKAEVVVREATDFVRTRNIVTLPTAPVQVMPMPEYQRGVAVANCSAPGALEKRGQTFLNISPPPENWNQSQVDSFFREYNDFMLRDLIVHEGMPGHYLQLAHAGKFSAPTLVRSVFRSGSFVEGWAVYAERVMADQGFGGPEVRMQQLKMWLRVIINALIDVGVHTEQMTEQQAMDLMMNEGFQERSEAEGKWRRVNLSSTQLSTYFVGTAELLQFRAEYEKRHGAAKELKSFHDRMLSFGAPPPRYLRQLMA